MQTIWKNASTLTGSLVTIVAQTSVVDYLAFANTHSAGIAVTVQDGNGKSFLPGSIVDAGTLMVIPIPDGGLLFFGGVQWKAATTDKVDAWIRIRQH